MMGSKIAAADVPEEMLPVFNPYDGQLVGEVPNASEVFAKEELARVAQNTGVCRKISKAKRYEILSAVADRVSKEHQEYAELIVKEAGKTIRQARKEVDRCINTLRLSAEEAKRVPGETIPFDSFPGSETRQGYYVREPLGLVVGITPYNDPLNLVAHKLGPAIASGNSFILKPSQLTPLSAIRLHQAALDAGFPAEGLSIITGGRNVGSTLVSHKDVRLVSFTGGNQTAEKIVRNAGLKRFVMDLGGNAPVIVMNDCDVDEAVESCVSGAFWASGQNCIGTQRILIEKPLYEEFKHKFVSAVRHLIVGDPMQEETDVGPMISEDSSQRAWDMVEKAIQSGATLLTGHKRQGTIYMPTVLENVPTNCDAWVEEVFAPIASLSAFESLSDALELANDSESSLHAGIFTSNLESALSAADQLQAGGVMINDSSDYRFDAMPFGGFKFGSMGREGVRFAIEEMTQTKVVCFNRS